MPRPPDATIGSRAPRLAGPGGAPRPFKRKIPVSSLISSGSIADREPACPRGRSSIHFRSRRDQAGSPGRSPNWAPPANGKRGRLATPASTGPRGRRKAGRTARVRSSSDKPTVAESRTEVDRAGQRRHQAGHDGRCLITSTGSNVADVNLDYSQIAGAPRAESCELLCNRVLLESRGVGRCR